ncbi:hypothetical protein [Kordia sp.]|uniref:hypothetical protein n=1 Tax=Kordia sp. TaxID=1965332 RepID=UPI003B5BF1BB
MHYKKNIDIDIEASKKAEVLIFIRDYASPMLLLDIFFDVIYYIILIAAFPVMSIFILIDSLNHTFYLLFSILYFIITVTIASLITYVLCSPRKLMRISGISPQKNYAILEKISKQADWDLRLNSGKFSVYKAGYSLISYGKELVVIYDHQDILINCINLSRMGSRSPFHWSGSRKMEKQIRKKFKQHLAQIQS